MSKSDIAAAIADNYDLPKSTASKIVDDVIDHITNAVTQGEGIAIRGFGSFSKQHREAKTGRNPLTGEAVQIPAKNVVKFKASRDFLAAIN